jgi:hypothetical protein
MAAAHACCSDSRAVLSGLSLPAEASGAFSRWLETAVVTAGRLAAGEEGVWPIADTGSDSAIVPAAAAVLETGGASVLLAAASDSGDAAAGVLGWTGLQA